MTSLRILAPAGNPPLREQRAVSAHAEAGRWSWHEAGTRHEFERPGRYVARRIRDQLDRTLLVEYLGALGIQVDQGPFFASGAGVRQHVPWPRRQVSVSQWKLDNGW